MSIFASPSDWPIHSRDYVFLATAVQEIGKKIFGAEWTGHEGEDIADEDDEDFELPGQEGRVGPDSAVLALHGIAKTLPPMQDSPDLLEVLSRARSSGRLQGRSGAACRQ